MRLAVLGIALLLLPALVPEVVHAGSEEDYAHAEGDDAALHATGGAALEAMTSGLDAALDGRHADAAARMDATEDLARVLTVAAETDADTATSQDAVAPYATAVSTLTTNVTSLVDAWTRLAEESDTDMQRVHAAVVREAAADAKRNADALDALGYDTTTLRDTLSQFVNAVDAKQYPDATRPLLHLTIGATTVTRADPVVLRGVLSHGNASGTLVTLRLDDQPWLSVAAGPDGTFRSTATAPQDARSGTRTVTAHAVVDGEPVASDPVTFDLVRTPTVLGVSLPSTTVTTSGPVTIEVRLRDHEGRGVEGPVAIFAGNTRLGVANTDPRGHATFRWDAEDRALGDGDIRATYTGSTLHAPSKASFRIHVVPGEPPRWWEGTDVQGPSLAFLVLVAVALHAGAAEAARGHSPQAFRAVLVVGPVVLALLAHQLLAAGPWTLGAFALAAATSAWAWTRSETTPAATALTPQPSPVSEAAGTTRERDTPSAGPASLPPLTSVATVAFPEGDPRREVVETYRALLASLAAEGVDVRPLTLTEVRARLVARGAPAAGVDAVTRHVRGVLYGSTRPTDGDLDAHRAAIRELGVRA